MNILIVEPYYTGSHAAWAEGYKKNSSHNVEILSLPGRYWKWRMHGGAVTLGTRFLDEGLRPDLILATDMLDLSTFLALTRPLSEGIPTAIYFHENQFTYPWHPQDNVRRRGRDTHYGFINFVSALSAKRVFFNSAYHMSSFLDALQGYLERSPDFNDSHYVDIIRKKSAVLYVGMDFKALDTAATAEELSVKSGRPPLVLWNHRWEYDKNPGEFFAALYDLMECGLEFEVAILGESFSKSASVFHEAKERLGKRVVHFGFAEDFSEYVRWLKRADILPVTSSHDFFGCSVVEAIYCRCFPILPRGLAYPEHLSDNDNKDGVETDVCFYDDFKDLIRRLKWALTNIKEVRNTSFKGCVRRYGWESMAQVYDKELQRAVPGIKLKTGCA